MRQRSAAREPVQIGIAYAGYVAQLLEDCPDVVDYIELPFELIRHDPSVLRVGESRPLILHCASLSVAGTVECQTETVSEIRGAAARTKTPWIGEHLAYVTAEPGHSSGAMGAPHNVGYTVSPAMNEITLSRASRALARYQSQLGVPIILENSPIYFSTPSTTMSQPQFVSELQRRTGTGLLLDLAHLYITSQTLNLDPFAALDAWPLEAVNEIHISGVNHQGGVWDDHARRAPEIVRQMFDHALRRATPRAVTLEYNWSINFPRGALLDELVRTREQVANSTANAGSTLPA